VKIHLLAVIALGVLTAPTIVAAEEINRDYCTALRKLSMSVASQMRKGTRLQNAVSWARAQEHKVEKYLENPQTVLQPLVYYVYGYQHDSATTIGEIGNLVMGQCMNGAYGNIAARTQAPAEQYASPRRNQPQPATPSEGGYSMGTGWPIAEGLVVTNHHVIAGHNDVVLIRTDGERIGASVLEVDADHDIALLRVDDIDALPPALKIADHGIPIGSKVFTIGYPHPDFMGSEPKLTSGIINALSGFRNDRRTYQISVALQSGNSGGPLISMDGEVVGIVTSKLRAIKVFRWTGDLPQNVNYAMKSRYLLHLLKQAVDMDLVLDEVPAGSDSLQSHAAKFKDSVMIVVAR
jgi:S1-C subfamily serine protease